MVHRVWMAFLVAVFCCALAAPASGDRLDISLSSPGVVSHSAGPKISAKDLKSDLIELPGFSSSVSPGDPALPCKLIYIALPPNTDQSSVAIDHSSYSTSLLPGSFRIDPVPPAVTADRAEHWGQGKDIVDGRNRRVYDSNQFYPEQHLRLRGVGRLRTWQVAVLEFWPYCYNPVTNKLREFDARNAALTYSTQPVDAAVSDPVAAGMTGFIENRDTALPWYAAPAYAPDAASDAPVDYVIITTSAIASSSGMLGHFVDLQGRRGHSVQVVTEAEWGGGAGDVAAENIRRWLQENYLHLGIKYVLLIGNPNYFSGDVPMKMFWPRRNQTVYREVPSDYYYADLTGNWDRDGDGYYGEQPDDFGAGGIDRIPEVYVGRIPCYGDIGKLDSILNKIIGYESSELGDWSRRVLLPMKPLDSITSSYQLGEIIRQDLNKLDGFSSLRFYDSPFNLNPSPEYVPCGYDSVLYEWKQGAGIVVWLTHGGSTYATEVMSSDRCAYLDDSKPAIVYAGSCNNGRPEESSNLAYSLLCQGAVSTLAASRVSWYYIGENSYFYSDSVGGLGYQYAKQILQQRNSIGEASMQARLNVPANIWPNQLVMNLYGDPSLVFDEVVPGAIAGRVLSAYGDPVPGAVVKLADGSASVVSKEDGSYRLDGLSPGEYRLAVACAGYHQQRFEDVPVFVGETTDLDFHLVTTGASSVLGWVTDGYGAPISDALVTVDNQHSAYSAQDGSFQFDNLTPGLHTVAASKAPYASKSIVDCLVPENKPAQVNVVLQSHRADVVYNSNFEQGFNESGIAQGWTFYTSHGYNAQPMQGSDRAKWGLCSQKLHMPEPAAEAHAGFYQTVPVTPGSRYTLVAWQRTHFGGEELSPADNVICRIGYDPTGGTAYFSPTVTWRDYNPTHDTWHVEFTDVLPFSDRITIFVEACRKQPGGGDDCYAWFDGIFLIGLAKAPEVPVVSVSHEFQTDCSSISASWTCSDPDIKEYEWAISTSLDESGIVPGGGWTNVGVDTSATLTGLNLKPGDAVRALVRATNSFNVTGEIGASKSVRIVQKLTKPSELKNARVGQWISLDDMFVTRMGSGPECYLEDPSRAVGFKAMGTWSSTPYLMPGTRTRVIGCVTELDGMRILTGAEVIPSTAHSPLGAYAMPNGSVGLPINLGLLVTTWGRVTSHTRDGFILNDGSSPGGLQVSCFNAVTRPAAGDFVRATGISTPYGLAVYAPSDIATLQSRPPTQ